jgi:hypothetical protein
MKKCHISCDDRFYCPSSTTSITGFHFLLLCIHDMWVLSHVDPPIAEWYILNLICMWLDWLALATAGDFNQARSCCMLVAWILAIIFIKYSLKMKES